MIAQKKLKFFSDNDNEFSVASDEDDLESDKFEVNDEVLVIDRNKEVSNAVKIIAPGQGQFPEPWHLIDNIDELCFPTIFGGYPFDTDNKLTYSKRVKSECRRSDRRSCLPTRVLFMAKRKMEKSVTSNINICLKKIKNVDLNVNFVKNSSLIDCLIQHDDGYRFLKLVRSSPEFWQMKQKHLMSFIRQKGFPTFFITLSASEIKWPELLQILFRIKHGKNLSKIQALNLDMQTKTKLIREDPVTCVRYIENRFLEITKILENINDPFEKFHVTDFFERREFQARGSVHSHGLYKCKDAPLFDENDLESRISCIKFIDNFITCKYDPKNPYMTFQRHKHKPTCYKGRKNKQQCRFHYPMFVMKNTMILDPLSDVEKENIKKLSTNLKKIKELMKTFFDEIRYQSFDEILNNLKISEEDYIMAIRSSLKSSRVFLKRRSEDVAINSYNETILNLIESNVDIQFVLDPYSCASYMTNYITNVDAGLNKLLKEAALDIENGNLSLRDKFRKIGNVFINGNVLSAQEAVYHCLSMALTRCNVAEVYINTVPSEQRVRMLKSKSHLEKLEGDSTDIFYQNIFEKYSKREKYLESICLAEFAASYKSKKNIQMENKNNNFESSDDDNDIDNGKDYDGNDIEIEESSAVIQNNKKLKLIRYRNYKLTQDSYNYYREQILLYFPWREE